MPVVLSGADQAQRRDCLLLTASERGKEHVRISLRMFSSHSNKIYTCLRRSLIKDLWIEVQMFLRASNYVLLSALTRKSEKYILEAIKSLHKFVIKGLSNATV